MDAKEAVHAFHNLVLTGKGGLVTLLLILSFINAQTELIQKEPRKFLGSTLLFALAGAVAGGFVAWNRNSQSEVIFNSIFITTLFFFFFGVCRELSGYYKLASGDTKSSQKMGAERLPLVVIGGFALVLGLIYGSYLVYYARVSPTGLRLPFPVELLVFTLICGAAEYGVGYQHGDSGFMTGVSSFGMYVIAHLFLQYGGFYDHVFAPINWNKFN
jgi:hypothetical protein